MNLLKEGLRIGLAAAAGYGGSFAYEQFKPPPVIQSPDYTMMSELHDRYEMTNQRLSTIASNLVYVNNRLKVIEKVVVK